MTWMLYGAYGYTGKLIVQEAIRRHQRPILAGRDADKIRAIADKYDLSWRVFDLDGDFAAELDGVNAVLHAAGPFSHTSAPMVRACMKSRTHYLDVTGEISVFEACHQRDAAYREAGIAVIPGVGFDVVPTDCLAARLKDSLPDATHLSLAFASGGTFSPGTAKTMAEGLPQGGAARVDGRIKSVPLGWKTDTIQFADKARTATTIPWGDVSTAYYSTGIPNIEVFMATPRKMVRAMKWANPVRGLLGTRLVQAGLRKLIDAKVEGPDDNHREAATTQLWGRVHNGSQTYEATLTTPDGYTLTAMTAVDAVIRVCAGEVEPGAKTPSMAFGSDYIEEFAGCSMSDVTIPQVET